MRCADSIRHGIAACQTIEQRLARETAFRVFIARAKDPAGLKRALHICRGHFKDYREGRGLFAKTHGIWWWDFRLTDSSHRHWYEIEETDQPMITTPIDDRGTKETP